MEEQQQQQQEHEEQKWVSELYSVCNQSIEAAFGVLIKQVEVDFVVIGVAYKAC